MTALNTVSERLGAADRLELVPPLLHAVAILGIPVAVVWATGGPGAIGFWIEALFHLIVAFTLGAAMFALVGYMVLAPITRLRSRFRPLKNDDAVTYAVVSLFISGGTIYFLTEPTLGSFRVDLPTQSPNTGAFLVILCAAFVGWSLFRAASAVRRRIGSRRPPKALSHRAVPHTVRPWGARPAEPAAEFWSPDAVVAWRSFAWDGRLLHGFRVAWRESTFVAECARCERSPGWDHACGIYAAKDREDVELFGQAPVIGRVEMWGDVVEHEFGYRSSHARITDVWVDSAVHARRLGQAYPDVRVWEGMPATHREVFDGEHR